jgi:hypothetical protein
MRIGIIGGGPAGISMAQLLTERGHGDVTVLERNEKVGGKSYSFVHEGLSHEMGTCYVAAGYTTTRHWMEKYGITEHAIHEHRIKTRAGEVMDFKEFVLGDGGMLAGGTDIARYIKHWLAFHEWELHGCPDDMEGTRGRRMKDEVAMPFREWLAERKLDVIERFALRTMTIMGYGALDKVPTLYGLRWNTPSLIWSAVTLTVAEPQPGWQQLWINMASELDVRLGQHIRTVDRTGGAFRVITQDQSYEFDHLVLTTWLNDAQAWFPFTAGEKQAWSIGRTTNTDYTTTLVQADGWFRDSDTRSFEAAAYDSTAIKDSHLLVARRTGDKSAAAKARSQSRPDVYVCYQYGAGRTKEQLNAILEADLRADGARAMKILTYCPWRYAPQLTTADIAAGAAGAMDRRQGKRNLWVTGSMASHEAVDNIVDYNERLVDRMEVAFDGGDPSSDETLARVAARHRFTLADK